MKVRITRFKANNSDLTFNDVVQKLGVGVTKKGKVVNVHFETTDKYIEVEAIGRFYGPENSGQIILLHPNLHVMGEDGVIKHLDDGDAEFYAHPDYWSAEVVMTPENNEYYASVVTPLKHEYFVSFVPYDEVTNYGCLEKVGVDCYETTK